MTASWMDPNRKTVEEEPKHDGYAHIPGPPPLTDEEKVKFDAELDRLTAAEQPVEPVDVELQVPTGRVVVLTPAASIKPLPVRWLWKDRIPIGELTLTPGYAGIGKSSWHAWIIALATRGLLPGVFEGAPKSAIICAVEDSWPRSIVPRLIVQDADLNRVYRADVTSIEGDDMRLSLPADLEGLRRLIVKHDVAVVSIDPLLSAIDLDLDTHKNREVREALEPLARLADEVGCVILGNAHFSKTSGTDPLLKITGTTAFGEVARAGLAFAFDKESGSNVVSQIKNNLGRLDLPNLTYRIEPAVIPTDEGPAEVGRFVFTGETSRSVGDVLNPHSDPEATARDIAEELLLDALSAGSQQWKTLAATLKVEGISEHTGRRARDNLKKRKLIDRTGGGGSPHYWHRVGVIEQELPEPA